MIIDASSIEVHFVRGFLQAPASVDLSFVRLITNEEPLFTYGDDEFFLYEDDEYSTSSPSNYSLNDMSNPMGGGNDIDEGDGDGKNDNPPDENSTETLEPAVPFEDESSKNEEEEINGNKDEGNEQEKDDFELYEQVKSEDSVEENEGKEENNIEKNEEKNEDAENIVEPSKSIIPFEEESNTKEQIYIEEANESTNNMGSTENNVTANKDDDFEDTPVDIQVDGRNKTRPEEGKNSDYGETGNDGSENQDDQLKTKTPDKETTNFPSQDTTDAPVPTLSNPDPASSPTPNDEGTRFLVQDSDQDTTTSSEKQILDVVLFLVPADCKKDVWGACDWVTLGVGAYDDEMEGGMSYCCSKDTIEKGICNSGEVGTLIVDHDIFKGDHREIDVPTEPLKDFSFGQDSKFDVLVSGDYVMLIANCKDDGLSIITLGSMEWKSVGGFLPGDIFGLMFFYTGLAAIYFVLTFWYYCGMKMYQENAIPIQKYIFSTMVIGFLEVSFLAIDLITWNITGHRSPFVAYAAVSLGILKKGSSRCLGVMVAMGWGVVRDSLGTTFFKIIFLGFLYSGFTLSREFLEIAAEAVQMKSLQEEELLDLALVLTPIIFIINLIFYCWIISSLSSTTEYLRNMNQTSKLRRHMRLRCLIITSLVIVGIVMTLSIAQVFTNYLNQDQLWIMQAVTHANYLFILFGVGILWRPNSHAKDYAMQMELPALGEGENELELSCVVPSAEDMEDDSGFKINDAVAT